jgi:predicted DNA-binding transcriptional regulator AlpA
MIHDDDIQRTDIIDPLLDERQLSIALRISLGKIRRWRARNEGPRVTRIGSSVRYSPDDVQAYIDACRGVR